jgi:dihydrodipicolinate synthase/N-acetylneuraminate lyase
MPAVAWRGVFPAATTQFHPDQSLDLKATCRHIDAMVRAGAHGMIVLGTVGENSSLEQGEKLEVLRAAVECVGRRVPVLAGVAECSTRLACRFAEDALKAGADGLMVLPAMVYKSDPRETLAHYRAVAGMTDLPIMVYNNPVAYAVDITPPMFAELADEPNFVAMKESSADLRRITDIVNLVGDRYAIFTGVDDLALESLMLGAVGWVAGLVCAFPRETVAIYKLATHGRYDEAREIYRWFMPLLHLDVSHRFVQNIKAVEAVVRGTSTVVRAPRLELEGAELERVRDIVAAALETQPDLARYGL